MNEPPKVAADPWPVKPPIAWVSTEPKIAVIGRPSKKERKARRNRLPGKRLKTGDWESVRWAVMDRDEVCVECGAEYANHVHHDDHDRTNNDLWNLVLLCSDCHKEAHRVRK